MSKVQEEHQSALERLRKSAGRDWPNIARAQAASVEVLNKIASALHGLAPSGETALVVFGSLARGEYTAGSDLDWALLIDGRVDSKHLKVAQKIRREVDALQLRQPGPTELFGGLVFSHDLVHAIGGQEDTNNNMTRRLLLLLESAGVPDGANEGVRARTVRSVLMRYVEEDASFLDPAQIHAKVPRFLLNDVVRFWRTMAVDYANKYREQAAKKWALRNIKLRMSRKLLFVSGLLLCLTWRTEGSREGAPSSPQSLVAFLDARLKRPALESLALAIERYGPDLAAPILDRYDEFLGLLNDKDSREALEALTPASSATNELFLKARHCSEQFDEALRALLFDREPALSDLIKKYGVF